MAFFMFMLTTKPNPSTASSTASKPASMPPLLRRVAISSQDQMLEAHTSAMPAEPSANASQPAAIPFGFDFSRIPIHPKTHATALEVVRTKQGIGMPIASNLVGPLKSWLGIDPSPVRIHNDSFASAAA